MSGEYDTELEIDRRYAEQAIWAPAYWRELNSSITCLNDYSLRYKDYEKGADTGCRTCVLVP